MVNTAKTGTATEIVASLRSVASELERILPPSLLITISVTTTVHQEQAQEGQLCRVPINWDQWVGMEGSGTE